MFKKIIIASAGLLVTIGVAFANGGTYLESTANGFYVGPISHQRSNFYVGVSVNGNVAHYDTTRISSYGYDISEIINTIITTTTEAKINFVQTTDHDFSGLGFGGDLFVGYGIPLQKHYYLGAEIFGSMNNNNATYSTGGDLKTKNFRFSVGILSVNLQLQNKMENEIKLGYSYGVGLIPGVKISDNIMLYGRIGLVRSRFEAKLNDQVEIKTISPDAPIIDVPLSGNIKKTDDGVQLGFGIETMVANNCSIRLEYDWNRYGSFNILEKGSVERHLVIPIDPVGDTITDQTLTVTSNVEVKQPTINQFKLAAVYHFTV